MNKSEFIKAVAERTGKTQRETEDFVFAAMDVVKTELTEGGSVDFTGFGKFCVKVRPERQGKNPATGETITIPEANVPAFKPGKILKEAVN